MQRACRLTCLAVILFVAAPGSRGGEKKKDPPPAVQPFTGAVTRLGSTQFWHPEGVRAIAFSRDGKTLALGGPVGVRVVNVPAGTDVLSLDDQEAEAVALSPDGKLLAAAGGLKPTLTVWELPAGKQVYQVAIRPLEVERIRSLTFSADSKTLYSTGAVRGVCLWDVESGRVASRVGTRQGVDTLQAVSPNGKQLITAEDDTIFAWETEKGQRLHDWKSPAKVTCLAVRPDGGALASGGTDGRVRNWDLTAGKELAVLEGHPADVIAVAFSPDGKLLASAGRDTSEQGKEKDRKVVYHDGPTVRVWDAAGKPVCNFGQRAGKIDAMAFSPDGKILATAGDRVTLWDPLTGKELNPFVGHRSAVDSLTVFPDGRHVASTARDRTVRVWDLETGNEVRAFDLGDLARCPVRIAPDGKTMAWGEAETVCFADPLTGKRFPSLTTPEKVRHLGFSPDGLLMATVGDSMEVHLRDRASRQVVRKIEVPGKFFEVEGITFSPDSKLLAVAADFGFVFEVATGKEIHRVRAGALHPVTVGFSPDGQTLLTGSSELKLSFWDIKSGEEVGEGATLECSIVAVAVSPDGRMAAVAGNDNTIYLVETASRKQRRVFTGHRDRINDLAFSRDGGLLISASDDTTIVTWDVYNLRKDKADRPAPLNDRELARLWNTLTDDEGAEPFQTITTLIQSPDDTLKFIRQQMRPVPKLAPGQLEKMVRDLDSDEFDLREKATNAIEAHSESALPVLRKELAKDPPLEVRRRIELLLARLETKSLSPELLRGLRALEVLEHIGTVEARKLLAELADGAPGTRQTIEAKAAMDRLVQSDKRR